jgi:hypothetical protein
VGAETEISIRHIGRYDSIVARRSITADFFNTIGQITSTPAGGSRSASKNPSLEADRLLTAPKPPISNAPNLGRRGKLCRILKADITATTLTVVVAPRNGLWKGGLQRPLTTTSGRVSVAVFGIPPDDRQALARPNWPCHMHLSNAVS